MKKRHSKLLIISIITVALLASLLAGCTSKSSEEPKDGLPADEPATEEEAIGDDAPAAEEPADAPAAEEPADAPVADSYETEAYAESMDSSAKSAAGAARAGILRSTRLRKKPAGQFPL